MFLLSVNRGTPFEVVPYGIADFVVLIEHLSVLEERVDDTASLIGRFVYLRSVSHRCMDIWSEDKFSLDVLNRCGLSMDECNPVSFMVDDLALVGSLIEHDEVDVPHLLRKIIERAVRVGIDFPVAFGDHRELRVVEGKVVVDIILSIDSVCVLRSLDYQLPSRVLSVGIDTGSTKRDILWMLDTHVGEVRAVLVDGVSDKPYLDITALTDDSGTEVVELDELIEEVTRTADELIEEDGSNVWEGETFVGFLFVDGEGVPEWLGIPYRLPLPVLGLLVLGKKPFAFEVYGGSPLLLCILEPVLDDSLVCHGVEEIGVLGRKDGVNESSDVRSLRLGVMVVF